MLFGNQCPLNDQMQESWSVVLTRIFADTAGDVGIRFQGKGCSSPRCSPRRFSGDGFLTRRISISLAAAAYCFHSYPSVVRAAAYPVIPESILVDQRLASVGS